MNAYIRVVDACDPSGTRVPVRADNSFDLRKRIALSQAEICPPGRGCRCLEMEIQVIRAPSGRALISSADFFYSANSTY